MQAGTDTGVFRAAAGDPNLLEETEVLRRLHEIGFRRADLSMFPIYRPEYFLCQDDWQKRVDEIAETAAKLGMKFSQIHVPFVRRGVRETDADFQKPGYAEHYDECMRRAYIAGGMVGAPWAVAHCDNYPLCYDREASMAGNHAYYDRYVELGIRHGIGTCFENMIQHGKPPVHMRFTARYDDLIEFVDSFHDPMVRICWDFGHANLTGLDQAAALRKVGKRLACLHVNDNYGTGDHHVIPFVGTVDWLSVIPVLAEIGYEGECSLEVGPSIQRAPRQVQNTVARAAYEAAGAVCRLFDEAKERQKQAV